MTREDYVALLGSMEEASGREHAISEMFSFTLGRKMATRTVFLSEPM